MISRRPQIFCNFLGVLLSDEAVIIGLMKEHHTPLLRALEASHQYVPCSLVAFYSLSRPPIYSVVSWRRTVGESDCIMITKQDVSISRYTKKKEKRA